MWRFRTAMALSGHFPVALSGHCGALRTQMALSGHYGNFGAQRTARCNGAFSRFLNICSFFDNTAEKVHTLCSNTYLFNARCF